MSTLVTDADVVIEDFIRRRDQLPGHEDIVTATVAMGGGSRGISGLEQLAAIRRYLGEEDIASGTSTGLLIQTFKLAGQLDDLERLFIGLCRTGEFINLLRKPAIDIDRLMKAVEEGDAKLGVPPLNQQKVRDSRTKLYGVMTALDGKTRVFDLKLLDSIIAGLNASAAMPGRLYGKHILLTGVELPPGGELFTDGAYDPLAGVLFAQAMGANRILVASNRVDLPFVQSESWQQWIERFLEKSPESRRATVVRLIDRLPMRLLELFLRFYLLRDYRKRFRVLAREGEKRLRKQLQQLSKNATAKIGLLNTPDFGVGMLTADAQRLTHAAVHTRIVMMAHLADVEGLMENREGRLPSLSEASCQRMIAAKHARGMQANLPPST
jgi:predicted patatin/cPLA2 family phospholipase